MKDTGVLGINLRRHTLDELLRSPIRSYIVSRYDRFSSICFSKNRSERLATTEENTLTNCLIARIFTSSYPTISLYIRVIQKINFIAAKSLRYR